MRSRKAAASVGGREEERASATTAAAAAAAPCIMAGATGGMRKKALGTRTWILIDSDGGEQVVEAGKHVIMRRTGLPARDLRILDPILSYPSTILGRERAIVVNLEHIKAIITAQEVLLLESKDHAATVTFISDLRRRLQKVFNPHSFSL